MDLRTMQKMLDILWNKGEKADLKVFIFLKG